MSIVSRRTLRRLVAAVLGVAVVAVVAAFAVPVAIWSLYLWQSASETEPAVETASEPEIVTATEPATVTASEPETAAAVRTPIDPQRLASGVAAASAGLDVAITTRSATKSASSSVPR